MPNVKRALFLIAASAAVYATAAWWAATRLPDHGVAMHIDRSGHVNQYGSRASAVTYFVGLGGVLLLLAVAVVCLCRWTPVRYLNIPNKDYWITPERAPIVRRMIVWDAAVIFSMPLLALSFIPVSIALETDNPAGVSALWTIGPIGILLVALAGYVIWMVVRRYRFQPPA
jgi:hypothetical protein